MRLFIASPLETAVEEELAAMIDEFRTRGGSVRWVNPKNIHLTLRFLGDTDEDRVEKVKAAIDQIVPDFSAVKTSLSEIGAFPNLRRPRVIWVGLDQSAEPIAKMARQIELAMRKLRFQKEKPFRAHLTLGRIRKPRDLENLTTYLEEYRFDPIPVTFDRVVLFKSTLTPKGPIYERLHEVKLGQETFGE